MPRIIDRHGPSAPPAVGLLYCVYAPHHRSMDTPYRAMATARRYLAEAVESRRSLRATNPLLAAALARDGTLCRANTSCITPGSLPFEHFVWVAASSRSHWAFRLAAIGASPFALTLEVDSTATFCSPTLHPLLLKALKAPFDFVVNFGETGLRCHSIFGPPPRRVEDILPQNFACWCGARKAPR